MKMKRGGMLKAIYLHLQLQKRKIISLQNYASSSEISTDNV